MASINSTPAEIWQWILRYVINVPIFLDPDGITDHPTNTPISEHVHFLTSSWNDEGPYWAAERSRNICRRVCRAWDGYLGQTVGHRFVRVQDVNKERVHASALNTAIRISAAYYPDDADDDRKFNWFDQKPEWCVSVVAFVALFAKDHASKAQILVARSMAFQPSTASASESDLASLARQLPRLVTIVHEGMDSESVNTFKHFPSLRHLHTVPPHPRMTRIACGWGRSRMQRIRVDSAVEGEGQSNSD
jgi:hypothetical protein